MLTLFLYGLLVSFSWESNGILKKADEVINIVTFLYKVNHKLYYIPETDTVKVVIYWQGQNYKFYRIIFFNSSVFYDDSKLNKIQTIIRTEIGVLFKNLT